MTHERTGLGARLACIVIGMAAVIAAAGCGSKEIIGDSGFDPWADPFDDPFADTGGGDTPDAMDTIPADSTPTDSAPYDSTDAPWDFPTDGGGPDWTVPDFWDAPFDYMDVPPDYEPDAASCGNGVVDEGEECDDGNDVDHDECTNRCLFPRCGDGSTWWGWEDCDPPGTARPCTTSCGSTGGEFCEFYCRWTGTCVPPLEICGNAMDDDCDWNADGFVRDPFSRTVSVPPLRSLVPVTYWTGSGLALLWEQYPDIRLLSMFDPAGNRTAPDVPLEASIDEFAEDAALVLTPAGLGILYMDADAFLYELVPLDGSAGTGPVFVRTLPTGWGYAIAAWNGSGVVAVIAEPNADTIWAHEIAADGSSVGPEVELHRFEGGGSFALLSLVPRATDVALLYFRAGLAIDTLVDGPALSGTIPLAVPVPEDLFGMDYMPTRMAWTGTRFAIAATTEPESGELHLYMVNPDGSVARDTLVSTTASIWGGMRSQFFGMHLIWNGSEMGLLWPDNVLGSGQVFFSRFREDGVPLMPNARVSDGAGGGEPAMAWTGTSYGVFWEGVVDVVSTIQYANLVPCG